MDTIIYDSLELEYTEFVRSRAKNPVIIDESLTPNKVNLIHMQMGISGEAGEITDCIKKHTMYNQPLDLDNLIEELGDLEFYLEGLRQELKIDRDTIIQKNIKKLSSRYPQGYSDKDAQERKDKVV